MNSNPAQRILLNSLPKGGTHLVAKAIQGLLPWDDNGFAVDSLSLSRYPANPSRRQIMIGIAMPRPVPFESVKQALHDVPPGRYVSAHLPFQPELAELVGALQMKCVIVLRDPRDVVVSQSHYAVQRETHRLHRLYTAMTPDQRLMTSIQGLKSVPPDDLPMIDINRRVRSILPWCDQPKTQTCCFERLIGPAGGGSAEAQHRELRDLAQHLGMRKPDEEITRIAGGLFGRTATFRQGQIGGWREHFNDEHRQVFKEIAGPLLIELGYEKDLDW